MPRKTPVNFLKRLIMIILFLLVGLFMLGMGVMAYLNLNYSQKALSELRLKQIEDAFYANLDRINAHYKLMEKNLRDQARLGELFYAWRLNSLEREAGETAEDKPVAAPPAVSLEVALQDKIHDFPDIFGGGLWFEPGSYPGVEGYFGIYAYGGKNRIKVKEIENKSVYDYPRQAWYLLALPEDWDRSQLRPSPFYWSPAYYHPILEDAVITLATFMHDPDQRIIGLATSEWKADEIVQLVSGVDITPSSFSFLLDANNRKLSSLSQEDSREAQALLTALTPELFEQADWTPKKWDDGLPTWDMKTLPLEVGQRKYQLFFSKTRAGMVFGISVPHDEIYSVLEEMRQVNISIAVGTGLILLLLSILILYIVAGIMRLLETLYTDSLTGLPNRARLLQDLTKMPRASLILLNLDAFKEINDFYGYKCGDYILRDLAERLRAFLASSPQNPQLYKLPADEFGILFRRALTHDELRHCQEELLAFVHALVLRWEEQDIGVNATLGGAVMEHRATRDREESRLPAHANMALKLARKQARHYLIYDEELRIRESYQDNLLWAKKLKAAIQGDRIVPYFQPILNNHTGKIEKFECLVRLIDEQGRPVSPGKFMEVAKKLRLYRDLTRIMVEKTFALFLYQPYEFSLNLSYQDLTDEETKAFIRNKLTDTGIAGRAVFEILESESIENYQQIHSFVAELKALGCKIPIDDFGTGYSNFEHLLRLEVDMIKIDGSLIRSLDSDRNARIVTQGIVNFARKLNIQTVAEFVHNRAVQEKVLEMGIDYSQGYYIGLPTAELKFKPDFEIPG